MQMKIHISLKFFFIQMSVKNMIVMVPDLPSEAEPWHWSEAPSSRDFGWAGTLTQIRVLSQLPLPTLPLTSWVAPGKSPSLWLQFPIYDMATSVAVGKLQQKHHYFTRFHHSNISGIELCHKLGSMPPDNV